MRSASIAMGTAGLACLLLAACGGDDTRSGGGAGSDAGPSVMTDGGTPPGSPADGGGVGGEDASTPEPPSGRTTTPPDGVTEQLVGHWAMQSKTVSVSMPPFMGEVESTSVAYSVVEITEVDGTLQFTEQGCHVDSESSGSITTTVPDAIPRSVPPGTSTLEFLAEGGEVKWFRPVREIVVGADVAEGEALPTEADDPRVNDQDGDGNPGVTVMVSSAIVNGSIYVVQRNRNRYEGTLAGGTLSGIVHPDGSSQQVIGADNMILNMNLEMNHHADRSLNTIRTVKLDSEYDCDQLTAERDSLF